MYRTTIKGAFSNERISQEEAEGLLGSEIYVVRDGDVIFYVGKSSNPFSRLHQHMGYERKLPSDLGTLIRNNSPESDEWTLECYRLKDCMPFIKQSFADMENEDEREFMVQFSCSDASRAEKHMIRYLRPCLNTLYNENPSKLPEKYQRYTDKSSAQYLKM